MSCGVYEIWIGKYFYQGSSNQLQIREKTHFNELINNCHKNKKMQNVFNKYKTFEFRVIIECEPGLEKKYEQDFIDTNFGLKYCLNLSPNAWAPTHNTSHTEESKTKISLANLGKQPWNKGLKTGPQTCIVTDEGKRIKAECMRKTSTTKIECPHCKKFCSLGNATRWHFEKCKINFSK